jgi:predicted DCC family thiol-disulfide oxidoreductase YuxK
MTPPVLIYDGLCKYCNRAVQFSLAHDTNGGVRFATLQGAFARDLLARRPEFRQFDSLIFSETDPVTGAEIISTRFDAVLALSRHLGGGWRAMSLLRVFPAALRNGAYESFARMRYRLFGKYDSCPVPGAAQRQRFID